MARRTPNLIERTGLWLAKGYVKEAFGYDASASVDSDDFLYRRVTDSRRDINPVVHRRAQEISLWLWQRNPMAKRVVEMIADFTVGADGLRIEADDDKTQRIINEWWSDPGMRLEERFRDLVRDESIYGELALRRTVNETSGRSRLGLISQDRIKDVLLDRGNALLDDWLILSPDDNEEDRSKEERVRVINWRDDGGTERWTGEAHFFTVNRIGGQKRGLPDLFAIADYVDGYDQLLFNALERSGLINAFVFDVTLQGADETAVDEWLRDHGESPRPGSLRVHNEKEVWGAVTPDLGTQDVITIGRAVKNMGLGGAGLPEAWFAEGDSANRATLAAQGDPTYRMLQSRQRHVRTMVELMVGSMLQEQVGKRLRESRTRAGVVVPPQFKITMPDISAKDTSTLSAALPQVASAMATAIQEKWIDRASSRSVFLMMVNQLGLDLDAKVVADAIKSDEEEAKKVADEEAKKAAASAAQAQSDLKSLMAGAPTNGKAPKDAVLSATKSGGQPPMPTEL